MINTHTHTNTNSKNKANIFISSSKFAPGNYGTLSGSMQYTYIALEPWKSAV